MIRSRWLRTAGGTLALLLATGPSWAGEGRIRRSPNAVKDEYIVVLSDTTPRAQVPEVAQRLASAHGGVLRRVWQDAVKGFSVRIPAGGAEGLSHRPEVKYVEENALMFPSASVPTNIDPATGATTADNRLWHLDAIDQSSPLATNEYSYCETGQNVHVYVVDDGVLRAHREFNNEATRVLDGFDASGDPAGFPASDPCRGPGLSNQPADGQADAPEVREHSHGTAVAALVAGRFVGAAREAKVVPIKVRPCARAGARKLNENTYNKTYATGEIVYVNGTYYRIKVGGTTGAQGTFPYTPWPDEANPCCQNWNGVQIEWIAPSTLPDSGAMTIEMAITGLNWILSPQNPYPRRPAVVTLSTFRVVGETGMGAFEDAIRALLQYEDGQGGRGITVTASANNQDANACDTSPARMSLNHKVVTVGGTMIRNNPEGNPATGGQFVNAAEPPHVIAKPTIFARWRCHAGDSSDCSGNIYANPPASAPLPPFTTEQQQRAYAYTQLGSNGGPCVTLFAPAKNITVPSTSSLVSYRNARATRGTASGTSWSAPIVAAMAARILQNASTYSVDQVYNALIARTAADLDPNELDPPGLIGTPNRVLRLTSVVVNDLPPTIQAGAGGASINVTATGTGTLTYELFEVDSRFDIGSYSRNAAASWRVQGPTMSPSFTVAAEQKSYFVRVKSNCGSADTNITTIQTCLAPAITRQPVGASITTGASYSLSVTASGDGPFTYQWYAGAKGDTSNAVGTNSSSLTVTAATTTSYWVRVTGACGSIDSEAATVTAVAPSTTGLTLYTIPGCRVLDTREASGSPAIGTNDVRLVQVSGNCGVPATAKAVALNVTAITPPAAGWLILYPSSVSRPFTSTLNYRAAKVRNNNAIIPLSPGGQLTVYNYNGVGATHVTIDLTGYFE